MNRLRFSPGLLIGVLIAAFCGLSLVYRICLPYGDVFVGDWIKFTSNDAYYQMRLVDGIVGNFPNLPGFDPYLIYPGGSGIGSLNFFAWLLAACSWLFGLGSPTQHTIDMVGAYAPPVMAALTVIPVYFIGRALFNRWVGVLAAALIAVFPGEYLGRTIIGFTDLPAPEVLFSTVAVLFLILAVRSAGERQLTWAGLLRGGKNASRPLAFSLLAGLFLGVYLITWMGSPLFVFIISLYFIIQFIINHLKRRPSDHLGIAGFAMFLVANIVFLPLSPGRDIMAGMIVAMLLPPVLWGVSRLLDGRGLKAFYYPLSLVAIGLVFVAILYGVAPGIPQAVINKFGLVFFPAGSTAITTLEMQHFLAPDGNFSTQVAWGNFTTSFFMVKAWPIPGFAFISLFVLVWFFTRQRTDVNNRLIHRILNLVLLAAALVLLYFWINENTTVLLVLAMLAVAAFLAVTVWLAGSQRDDEDKLMLLFMWTLVILVATLVQRRFAYYLVVNLAVLSACISWQGIWLAGLKKLANREAASSEEPAATVRSQKTGRREPRGVTIYHVNTVLAIIAVFFLVFFWNITKSQAVASAAPYAPSDAWQSSLEWMRDNTTDPMGSPEAYHAIYQPPPAGEGFDYPDSAYGVTTWWDYGYWVTRIAHRLPSANPSQDPVPIKKVAGLFLSEDAAAAREIMAELDSSYVITEYDLALSKFWAIANWAGQPPDKYTDTYYMPYEGKLVPVSILYPEYYRTLLVRLYNFDGQVVADGNPIVFTYEEMVTGSGQPYKRITDFEEFDSYEKALDYVAGTGEAKTAIIGRHPFISPIPLEAVEDYRLVYSSNQTVAQTDMAAVPEIKIFEYLK